MFLGSHWCPIRARRTVEAAFARQARVQRRLRNRVQHAHRRLRDPGRDENSYCRSKIWLSFIIEADDHAAPDIETRILDRVDAFEERSSFADVLELLRLRSDSSLGLSTPRTRQEVPSIISCNSSVLGEIERGLVNKESA